MSTERPQGEPLFRPEVAQAREQDWMGSVQVLAHRLGWRLALLPVGSAVVLVLLLVFGEYTRSEEVRGQLLPAKGLVAVSAPAAGVISIAVVEGQYVEANHELARVSIERDSGEVGRVGAAVAEELDSQRQRLESQLSAFEDGIARRTTKLEQQRSALQRQLTLVTGALSLRKQQQDGARGLLERISPIRDSGQLTALQIHQFESAVLEAQVQVELAQLQQLDVSGQIASVDAELDELPTSTATERNSMLAALAETVQTIARNAGEQSLVIRAPRAGRVSGLNAVDGQSVVQGQQLLAVIPEPSELLAELWIPARAVGRIRVGTRVAMRYDAFPYQQYGQQFGRIAEIAHRALSPEEVNRSSGLQIGEASYRALVIPDQQRIDLAGESVPLRTNMTLQAAVLLDRRRLIELLNLPARVSDPGEPTRAPPVAAAERL
ncbi:MAG: HlyD family secretion protein [Pseudomarimonas sp.]